MIYIHKKKIWLKTNQFYQKPIFISTKNNTGFIAGNCVLYYFESGDLHFIGQDKISTGKASPKPQKSPTPTK
jgi:hypothetical protein